MIPFDEITFHETINPFCIDCGSGKIVLNKKQPPFAVNDGYIVISFICTKCGYSFGAHIFIKPNSIIKDEA